MLSTHAALFLALTPFQLPELPSDPTPVPPAGSVRAPAAVGPQATSAGQLPLFPGGPQAFCAAAIADMASPSGCLGASSVPLLGALLPLGPLFYVSPAGEVGIGTTAPLHALDVVGDLRASGRAALGDLAEVGPHDGWDQAFELSQRVQDFSGAMNWAGVRSLLRLDPPSSLTGLDATYVHGGDFVVETEPSSPFDFEYVQAPNLWAIHSGSGNVGTLCGADSAAENRGTADAVIGLAVQATTDFAGQTGWSSCIELIGGSEAPGTSVQTNVGIFMGEPLAEGTLVDNYGIYLRDQVGGSGSNYAIYSEGGTSYFAGPIGIGTAAPTAALEVVGDFAATGTKSFVEAHPTDPSKEIWFACLEGNEAGTYFRGRAALSGGRALVPVPEDFRAVTEAVGLTVQLTAMGPDAGLWVESIDLDWLVVQGAGGAEFSYLVNGVRRGQAGFETIRERAARQPSPLPASPTERRRQAPESQARR